MQTVFRLLGAVTLLGLITPFAIADEILPPTDKDQPLVLGLGVIYRDKVYDGYDDGEKAQAIPLIMWENERFFFRGATGGWKLVDEGPWEVAVIVEGRGDGYDSDDADILANMDDRDQGLDAGVQVNYQMENGFGLKGTWVADITSKSEGYELRAEGYYITRRGNWLFRPSAAVVLQSDDLVDYYYGVQLDEVDTDLGRTFYQADDEILFRVQAAAGWNPGGSNWQIIFGVRADFLGDEIDDSPIVDDDVFLMGFLAAGYKF